MEPLSQSTPVQIGLVIAVAGPLLWGAVRIEALTNKVDLMQVDTDKIPAIELNVSHIKRDIADLNEKNDSVQNFKRRNMARWCEQAERLNEDPTKPFRCADVYGDLK